MFSSLRVAQQALDEWVEYYNTGRSHQSLDDATPASRFTAAEVDSGAGSVSRVGPVSPDRTGPDWVTRKVAANGVVCVDWQQVSVGKHRAGQRCDVLVADELLQFWVGNDLLKTVLRAGRGPVRKHNAAGTGKKH